MTTPEFLDVVDPRTVTLEVELDGPVLLGATGPAGVGVPAGGTLGQVLTKNSSTDYDDSWQTPTGGGASLTALHSALLAVKVWSGSAYVWSGDGTAPDAASYTQIMFVDPSGLHDPMTSPGGRTDDNDLWETGGVGPVGPAGPPGPSGSLSGTAGGSLTGTYPNPTIANNGINNVNMIAPDTITNNALFDMVQATIKGRQVGVGTGTAQDLTSGQATAILDLFTSTLKGLTPASGGGTTNFLRADGTWNAPTGATTLTASTQTASYTLALTDAGSCVEMNVASANTLTVPPNSAVAFPTGTVIEIHQYGAGQTTLTPGAGVTIRSDGAKLRTTAQYASASLRKRATDEWVAAGDLST